MNDRTECKRCGAWGPVGEYHPFAFCLMVEATNDPETARANLNAVLDYGRKLERLKLPNDAPIALVREPEAEGLDEVLGGGAQRRSEHKSPEA